MFRAGAGHGRKVSCDQGGQLLVNLEGAQGDGCEARIGEGDVEGASRWSAMKLVPVPLARGDDGREKTYSAQGRLLSVAMAAAVGGGRREEVGRMTTTEWRRPQGSGGMGGGVDLDVSLAALAL